MKKYVPIVKTLTATLTALLLVFALLSGAELYGGGITGIIQNSPNALPWVILAGAMWVTWRKERAFGGITVLMGLILAAFAFMATISTDTYGAESIFGGLALIYLTTGGFILFSSKKS